MTSGHELRALSWIGFVLNSLFAVKIQNQYKVERVERLAYAVLELRDIACTEAPFLLDYRI